MAMKVRYLYVVLVALVGSAVIAADPTDRLCYYKENVQSKDSGVYENAEDIYVHVRKPVKGAQSPMRIRMKAIGEMNDLLRGWAIDFARTNQAVWIDENTIGVSIAVKVLDNANPLWRYAEWKCRVKGQEFTGSKDGYFWICQVFDKASVIKQIPEDFYKSAPPTNTVFKAVSRWLPAMMKADAKRLYSNLGVIDLQDFKSADKHVSDSIRRVDAILAEYKKSKPYLDVKAQHDRLSTLREMGAWSEVPGPTTAQHAEDVRIVTNVMACVNENTNSVDRAETREECQTLGMSENGMMHEETRVAHEEEIVETRTVTTVTTKKTIRRRTVTTVSGNPGFEEIFLSGGLSENKKTEQRASGAAAAKVYCGDGYTLEQREKATHDALCENPGDVQMWNLYGRCLMKRGDYIGALICFRAAAMLDANDKYTVVNLAEAYDGLGCHRLACGYAVLDFALTQDTWCISKCKSILLK